MMRDEWVDELSGRRAARVSFVMSCLWEPSDIDPYIHDELDVILKPKSHDRIRLGDAIA